MHICVSLLFCACHTPRAVSEAQHLAVRCGLDEAEIFFSRQALNYALPFQSNGDGSWDFVSVLVGKLKVFWKSLQNSQKHQHI